MTGKMTSDKSSPYRSLDAPPNQTEGGSSRLQKQASELLVSPSSRPAFQSGKAENGSEGLHKVAVPNGSEKSGAITEAAAVNVGGSTAAIKGMNADVDQVNKMMDMNPTAELFAELKDQNPDEALNFAERNPEFQRQALHDMGDESFSQSMRVRLTGQA
jgi:hypothetical protein